MRIAIIEDNESQARALAEQIRRLFPVPAQLEEIGIYASGEAFLGRKESYDLLMIDCVLPDGNGVELARTIRETDPGVVFVFVTAYLEFAAEGYETNAFRYLLKPVSDEKLGEALSAFWRQYVEDPVVEITGTGLHKVFLKTSEIIYCEYSGRKVVVRTLGEAVDSQKNLLRLQKELGDSFFRTDRRFLVNLRYISRREDSTLILLNGERVNISRRQLPDFNTAYIRFLRRRESC